MIMSNFLDFLAFEINFNLTNIFKERGLFSTICINISLKNSGNIWVRMRKNMSTSYAPMFSGDISRYISAINVCV